MKLETVSKIKGWVAVVGLSLGFAGLLGVALGELTPGLWFACNSAGVIGMIYAVKWIRLRRRMREWEYRRVVSQRG